MLEVHRSGRSAVHDAYLREHGLTRLDPRDGAALLDGVTRLSFQFPGEHCTECAAPDCHGSCDLFERGSTGRCKRFADGIVVRRGGVGAIPYVLEVLFRPWGHFLAVANTLCVEPRAYRRLAWWIPTAGRLSYLLQSALRPLPPTLHWRVSDKIRGAGNYLPRLLNRLAQRPGRPPPDALLCIAGNPQREPVQIELSLSGFGASQGGRSVRRAAAVPHGWHALAIGTDEIRGLIDLGKLFRFSVVPLIEKPALLQFLYVGFVTRGGTPAAGGKEAEKKVKLAVLDLDNTLWDGVLIENPDKEFALLPGVRATLEELDRRGILLSVASKNYPEEGRKVLEKLGLWALFLHPQINWDPKSLSIQRIVRALNIGLDSVAFIDDSPFELAEVRAALPDVRTFEAARLAELPALDAFRVPVTEESRRRRALYQEEGLRETAFRASALDYDAFLASCGIRLILEDLSEANTARVFELVQRTNQLNFSGNRYTREDLAGLLRQPGVVAVVMRCEDRFGTYGIVGFSIVRAAGRAVEMTDLMFSCRIQGKRIEHAYLVYLFEQSCAGGAERLVCRYRRTARNSAAARVFADLSFEREAAAGEPDRETHALVCGRGAPGRFPAEVADGMHLGRRLRELPGGGNNTAREAARPPGLERGA